MKIDLKSVQKVELEILLEFDRICKKNNIKYQLFAGSLLGAIRHNGFIPWDDDIDVCLLRKDYDKFIEICNKDIKSEYFLQTNKTDPKYIRQFAKMRKNGTIYREKVTADIDMHQGLFIDIFPLDNVSIDNFTGELHLTISYILGRINLSRLKFLCKNTNKTYLKLLRLGVHYATKIIPTNLFNKTLSKTYCFFNKNENMEYVSHLSNGTPKSISKRYVLKKSEFYDIIEKDFEGHQFPISKHYNKILTNLFGDYTKIPPVENRKAHHGIIEFKFK